MSSTRLFNDHSAIREQQLGRFEDAWFAGAPLAIEDILPADSPDRDRWLAEFIHVDLEFRIKRGDGARIEDYLGRFPILQEQPSALFDLIAAECRLRSRREAGLSVDEYRQRFPELTDQQIERLRETAEQERQYETSSSETTLTWSSADADGLTESDARQNAQNSDSCDGSTAPISSRRLLSDAIEKRLVDRERVESTARRLGLGDEPSPKTILQEFVRAGELTVWQLKEIQNGRPRFYLENDRYLLLDEIGCGGMGAVYRARHTRMKRDVALKVIDPSRIRRPGVIQRFHREIEVCARLQHEHVVRAYDVGVDNGVTFLVMEYVKGSDLSSLVRRDGPMAADQAAAICVQAAAGLAYAHKNGVVHRDIKPQNILLSTEGETKILDMGLARLDEEEAEATENGLTRQGEIMGTVDFMAPEQARDASGVDARCDIYALGATLYFLLTGRPPYPGGGAIEKLHRLANDVPQPISQLRPDCPAELANVVGTLMAKRRRDRYQSAEDVVRALRPFSAEKIAGRAVVTASVQTAAETRYSSTPTDTQLPFLTDDDTSPLTLLQRRRGGRQLSWNRKWAYAVGIASIALMLALVFRPWRKHNAQGDGQSSTTADQSVDSPQERVPDEIRVEFSGHSGPANNPSYTNSYATHWHGCGRFACFLPFQQVLRPTFLLAWSPSGSRFATGASDGVVRVWEVNPANRHLTPGSSRRIRPYHHHSAAIVSLAWSPDGKRIISGDLEGNIHVYSPDRSSIDQTIKRAPRLGNTIDLDAVMSPDGGEIAFAEPPSGNRPAHLVRWSLKQKRRIWEHPAGGDVLWYSRDGKLLVSADVKDYSKPMGFPLIRCWDLADNRELRKVELSAKSAMPLGFAADNQLVFLRESPNAIVFWDCRTGKETRSISLKSIPETPARPGQITAGWLSSDGGSCLIARRDGKLILVRLKDGSKTESESPRLEYPMASPGFRFVHSLPWRNHSVVVMFDRANRKELMRFDVFRNIRRLRLIRQQRFAIPNFGSPGAWDLQNARWVADIPAGGFVLKDGSVRQVNRQRRIVSWPDLDSLHEQPIEIVKLEDAEQYSGFTWSENEKLVWATATSQQVQIRFWDATTGRVVRTTLLQMEDNKNTHKCYPPVVTANGRFVTAGFPYPDGRLAIWNNGKLAFVFKASIGNAGRSRYVLSNGGRRVAVHTESDGSNVRVLDARTGKLECLLKTNQRFVTSWDFLEFDATGQYLLINRNVWDVRKAEIVWECPEAERAIGGFTQFRFGAFIHDGRYALVGQDGRYDLWDWRKNKKVLSLHPLPEDQWVMINHVTGHYAGSLSAFKHVRLKIKSLWTTPAGFRRLTGWETDPKQVGLKALPAN